MFVLRQFNSKINTTYLSMTVICLMLLMTIGVLSVTTSYNNSMQQMTSGLIPYDATFLSYDDPNTSTSATRSTNSPSRVTSSSVNRMNTRPGRPASPFTTP